MPTVDADPNGRRGRWRKIHHRVGAYPAEDKKEFAEMNLTDHAGVRLTHGKPKVNDVEIHYAMGGAGEPVFLLHGVPKTMSYWRHVVPLLTPHYTVVVVDTGVPAAPSAR